MYKRINVDLGLDELTIFLLGVITFLGGVSEKNLVIRILHLCYNNFFGVGNDGSDGSNFRFEFIICLLYILLEVLLSKYMKNHSNQRMYLNHLCIRLELLLSKYIYIHNN